jgi:hypothetical protein
LPLPENLRAALQEGARGRTTDHAGVLLWKPSFLL